MYSVLYFNRTISKSIKDVFVFAGVCLLLGHLLLRDYMPSQIVGAVGAGLILLILYYVLCHKRDVFGFLLLIFICSHFGYADNQGGLWNLLGFGIFLVYYITGRPLKAIGRTDLISLGLLLILLVSNLVGWVLRGSLEISHFLGIFSFLGIVFCYSFMSRIVLTPKRLRTFMYVLGILIFYMFLAGINQRFAVLSLNSPLIGAYNSGAGGLAGGTGRAPSILQHTELFGEYSMLMVVLTIPFVVSQMTQRYLNMRNSYIFWMFIVSLFNLLLSGTRSAFILSVVAGLTYLGMFLFYRIAVVDARKKYMKYIMMALVTLSLIGSFVGLDSTLGRFQRSAHETSFDISDVASGEGINRGPLFLLGIQRIQSDSWFVGYGSGTALSNYDALFNGRPTIYADFHNLYFALPIIYGWFGSFAFLALILLNSFRLAKIVLLFRRTKHYLMPLIIGLALFWPFFLIDQYKISILRIMNYQMLIWFYLGLSSAAIRTFYNYKPAENKPTEQEIAVESKV